LLIHLWQRAFLAISHNPGNSCTGLIARQARSCV